VFIQRRFERDAETQQEEPGASAGEAREADEKIDHARAAGSRSGDDVSA
jgi:hypothetical protein